MKHIVFALLVSILWVNALSASILSVKPAPVIELPDSPSQEQEIDNSNPSIDISDDSFLDDFSDDDFLETFDDEVSPPLELPHSVLEGVSYYNLSYFDLLNWDRDNHARALSVFSKSCGKMRDKRLQQNEYWHYICGKAQFAQFSSVDPQSFFEEHFTPILIGDPQKSRFTGYFEPELEASHHKTSEFQTALYGLPKDLISNKKYKYSREDIMNGALKGRGLELAYIKNPVDAAFLQIQGSGKLIFQNGSSARIGYAGKNNHKFRSIGLELVRRGELKSHEASSNRIKHWYNEDPKRGDELLGYNPSFVFFRWVKSLRDDEGPIGAMGLSITEGRSIAVDPKYIPLGLPVWMEKRGENGFHRLMIAQDVGSVIKGPQRADIFYGSGYEAEQKARYIRGSGRMVILVPSLLIPLLYGYRSN